MHGRQRAWFQPLKLYSDLLVFKPLLFQMQLVSLHCGFSNFASRSVCKRCTEGEGGGYRGGGGGGGYGGGRGGGLYTLNSTRPEIETADSRTFVRRGASLSPPALQQQQQLLLLFLLHRFFNSSLGT